MVHNGIEYRLEQLLAETYDLLKLGVGLNNDELSGLQPDGMQKIYNHILLKLREKYLKRLIPDRAAGGGCDHGYSQAEGDRPLDFPGGQG